MYIKRPFGYYLAVKNNIKRSPHIQEFLFKLCLMIFFLQFNIFAIQENQLK